MDSRYVVEFSIICDVCNFSFDEEESYEQHLRGKKHIEHCKRKQRLIQRRSINDDPGGFYCKSSVVECVDSDSNAELLKHEVQLENDTEDMEIAQEKATLDDDRLVCEVCGTTFNELIQYKLHVSSKAHKRAVRLKKLKGLISLYQRQCLHGENPAAHAAPQRYCFCPLCSKKFTEPEGYFRHMDSKGHKKRVALQKIFNKINAELTDSENDAELEGTEECSNQTTVGISGQRRCRSSSSFTATGDIFECNCCDMIFTEAVPFALHLASKPHEKAKRKHSLLAQLKDLLAEESGECGSSSEEQNDGKKSSG